jgi:pimeloyl-ACP methyl ester carboxylesterase
MRQRWAVPVDGVQLAADRWGQGQPVVVLVHAGVCDRRSWLDVAESLAQDRTVFAYDRRGHGDTPPTTAPFSHLDDLLAVVRVAAAEPEGDGTVWLVGSSMGGGLAVEAALAAPDLVAGLVLLAPWVAGTPESLVSMDAASAAMEERMAAAEQAGDLEEANRLSAWAWLDGPAQPEGRVTGGARELALTMNRVILENGVAEGVGWGQTDAWARLGEVAVPVVVACGDLDFGYIGAVNRTLAERLPDGRYVELAGVAHLPYLEQPGVVAELIAGATAGGAQADTGPLRPN